MTVVSQLINQSQGWGFLLTFLCFLPMAFYFADMPNRMTLDYVKTLEARIEQMEAAQQGD